MHINKKKWMGRDEEAHRHRSYRHHREAFLFSEEEEDRIC